MDKSDVIERIKELCPDAEIEVTGENCHFEVKVVSDFFRGKRTLQRQQPILTLFSRELANGQLHALSIKAKVPGE